jgi:hypothetical protein
MIHPPTHLHYFRCRSFRRCSPATDLMSSTSAIPAVPGVSVRCCVDLLTLKMKRPGLYGVGQVADDGSQITVNLYDIMFVVGKRRLAHRLNDRPSDFAPFAAYTIVSVTGLGPAEHGRRSLVVRMIGWPLPWLRLAGAVSLHRSFAAWLVIPGETSYRLRSDRAIGFTRCFPL